MSGYNKTPLEQVEELIQSLLIVRDSINLVEQGATHFLLTIYGQLRALVTGEVGAKRGNDPLLIRLAKKYNISLDIYRGMSIKESDYEYAEDLIKFEHKMIHFHGSPISLHQIIPSQLKTTLDKLMNEEVITNKGESITYNDFIKYFAEKAGGAHYDITIPEKDLPIATISGFATSMRANLTFFTELCSVVLFLGSQIVKTISGFELYIVLKIPNQDLSTKKVLIDQIMPNTP